MITRQFVMFCLTCLVLTIQPGLGRETDSLEFRLWLPAVTLVVGVMLCQGAASLCWAAILGLGVDCLADGRLGVNLVVATTAAFTVKLMWSERSVSSLLSVGLSLFVTTFLWRSCAAMADFIIDGRTIDLIRVIQPPLVESISTTVCVVCLLLPLRLWVLITRSPDEPSVMLANRWAMLTGG